MTCHDYKPDHNGECTNCDEPLEAHDAALLAAIMDAPDGMAGARLIHIYYYDADRADRTSRNQMYFHIGLLCGWLAKMQPRHEQMPQKPE
jgi:hypothetical protein